MSAVSVATHNKAVAFMKVMNTIIELIEDISQYIPEGKYIDIMRELQKTYNIQNEDDDEYEDGGAEEPQPQTLPKLVEEIL